MHYGYSNQFEKYIRATGQTALLRSDDERVAVLPVIQAHGRECCKAHPDITAALRIYKHYNLGTVFEKLRNLVAAVKHASTTRQYLAWITGLEDGPENFGKFAYTSNWPVLNVRMETKRYTKCSLISACEFDIAREVAAVEATRQRLLAEPGMDPAVLDLLLESILYAEAEPSGSPAHMSNHRLRNRGHPVISFADAVEHFKGLPEPWLVWEYQLHLDGEAMRFLMRHPGVLPPPTAAEETDVGMEMGLMFASKGNSMLQIQLIPQMVSWVIKSTTTGGSLLSSFDPCGD